MKHPISATRYSVGAFLLLFAFGATRSSARMQSPKVLDQPAKVISHSPPEGAGVTGI